MQNQTVTSTATVPTARAARYGKQLASHMGRKVPFTWDEESGAGTVTFANGRVHAQLRATAEALVIEITSPETDLDNFEDVLGRHLVRFGTRDGLVCSWRRSDGTAGTLQRSTAPTESGGSTESTGSTEPGGPSEPVAD